MRAGIKGTGMYVPPKVISNDDLVAMGIETTDEWIRTKTGMQLRHIAEDDVCTSDLAAKAGEAALKDAGVKPEDVDMLILATSSPDVILSSTAAITQAKLGCSNSGAFDVNSVCSGFVYAFDIGSRMVLDPHMDNVLVIGAELYSKILNWEDRTTCIYFGDGAGATLLQKTDEGGVLGSYLKADGTGASVIEIPAGGTRQDVDWVIPHQSNSTMIKVCMENLGLPYEKAYLNLEKYANCAGASIPIAIHEAAKDGSLKKGDIVATVGYGGGLSWGSNLIEW